jgi:alpha-ribazole phosphatase
VTSFAIHLMRHGAPLLPGRLLGHLDAPPDSDAMTLCVERAAGIEFATVVTSDLARARSPGAIIATARGVAHRADARWRELHFGAWEGADPQALPAQELACFWDDPQGSPPPGGERWSDLCARVGAAVSEWSAPTLVLGHAGAMRAALALLCGFTYRQAWAVDLPYAALLSLRFWPGATPSAQITGLVT